MRGLPRAGHEARTRGRDQSAARSVRERPRAPRPLRARGQVARGLKHPNIATLYGLESIDDQQLLIMELVEGETLAERIARGPNPLDEAIPIFAQIAEGLGAAHDKGVVHRDLKPANIKITPEGKVKILDFGLAKAFDHDDAPGEDTSQSPTRLRQGSGEASPTAIGVILGTAPYMSPEQARGKSVDERTDIWAFGCCLFEALTGRRAFEGETVTDTLAAVVKNEPQWKRLPQEIPSPVRTLLERCLTKDANRRKRDARDIGIDLVGDSAPTAETRAPRPRASSIPLALVSAVAAGLLVWSITRGSATDDSRTTRLEIYLDDDRSSTGPILRQSGCLVS